MLSLLKCREILCCESPESDSDLEILRDQLYGLARVVVEALPRNRRRNPVYKAPDEPAGFPDALAMLPEAERYEVEERAGIMEFDGGLDRDTAEREAISAYWRNTHRKELT